MVSVLEDVESKLTEIVQNGYTKSSLNSPMTQIFSLLQENVFMVKHMHTDINYITDTAYVLHVCGAHSGCPNQGEYSIL